MADTMVGFLEEELKKAQDEVARLRGENTCDACCGNGKPISGLPCMCGGSGKKSDAVDVLREELFTTHKRLDAALAEIAALRECLREVLGMWRGGERPCGCDNCTKLLARASALLAAKQEEGGR
jgi:hypothetical protein